MQNIQLGERLSEWIGRKAYCHDADAYAQNSQRSEPVDQYTGKWCEDCSQTEHQASRQADLTLGSVECFHEARKQVLRHK